MRVVTNMHARAGEASQTKMIRKLKRQRMIEETVQGPDMGDIVCDQSGI